MSKDRDLGTIAIQSIVRPNGLWRSGPEQGGEALDKIRLATALILTVWVGTLASGRTALAEQPSAEIEAAQDEAVDPPEPDDVFLAGIRLLGEDCEVGLRSTENIDLWRATPFIVPARPVSDLGTGRIPVVADPASRVVFAQLTDVLPPPPGPAPTATGQIQATADAGGSTGWLGNVLLSGVRSYIDVSPVSSILDPTALNAAFLEIRSDAGSVLENVPGIDVGVRTPIVSDPILNGRRNAQAPARGSYWFPARQDLDTLLSKIDSRIVQQFVTINGPYSVLYGPGLAFYDVELIGAPRFDSFQNHGATSVDYQTNGEQWSGRQSFWGGDENWGYRVGYGHRTGGDYESGSGVRFPSSYKSRMWDFTISHDLSSHSRVDFTYLRLDQTDVEYPGQYFDMNFLVTDAYEVVYSEEGQRYYDRLSVETWYNRTRFDGDNLRPGKRRLIPTLDLLNVVSTTDADAMSTGYRIALNWDDTLIGNVTAGTDLRYLKQRLNEFNSLLGGPSLNFPIPPSHSSNPGLFVQSEMPISDRLDLTAGARVDWVSTNADTFVPGTTENLEQALRGEFNQHFNLWGVFMNARYELQPCWYLDAGFGHAMRPPNMTELYAVGPFISAFPQQIFTSLFGNPHLDPERMWQIDVGISGKHKRFSGGLRGYYSWVEDYITLDFLGGLNISQYGYANTDLATLSGFDLNLDYEISKALRAFSTVSYVEGRDHSRNLTASQLRTPNTLRSDSAISEEPLPVMPPLDSRVGIVWHQPVEDPRWSIELAARIVDAQDRVATTLREQPTSGFTVWDIRAYALLFEHLTATAGVLNFTDKNYRTYYDTRAVAGGLDLFRPGISFYFGGQLDY